MDDDKVRQLMDRYQVSKEQAEIMVSRQEVYGEPKSNYQNISQIMAGLLQPWHEHIANGDPLPPHVTALMMVAMKFSRMRLKFSADNYEDLINYLMFAKAWHEEWEGGGGIDPPHISAYPADNE